MASDPKTVVGITSLFYANYTFDDVTKVITLLIAIGWFAMGVRKHWAYMKKTKLEIKALKDKE
jgi:hypothetical protein